MKRNVGTLALFAALYSLFTTIAGAQMTPQTLIDIPQTAAYEFVPESGASSSSTTGTYTPSDPAAIDAALVFYQSVAPSSFAQAGTAEARAAGLTLTQRYFTQAYRDMKATEKAEFARLLPGVSRYSSIRANPRLAVSLSVATAMAISNTDAPSFFLALAAAVFTLDPDNPNGADNFASAIVTSGERRPDTTDIQALRRDAEQLYRYAVAHSLSDGEFTAVSALPLSNLGNLYVDMERIDEARAIFLALRTFDQRSWDAAKGLAACYIAEGQPTKAKELLEDPRLAAPAIMGAARASAKELSDTDAAAALPVDSPDGAYEEAIQKLQSQEILTSADFVEGLDQSERNKIRYFVENLPIKGSYAAPPINLVAQFSTLRTISAPPGVSALSDFVEAFSSYALRTSASSSNDQIDMMEKLGLHIDLGVDLADVAAHPEKYENVEPDVTVSGMDEFMANVQNMQQMATIAQNDLATGKTASTVALASKVDPGFNILRIDPNAYADPYNIIIQKHNFVVFYRKMNAYRGYLYSVNKRTYLAVKDIVERTNQKIQEISTQEAAELAIFQAKKEAAQRAGQNTDTAEWKLREHTIHSKYFTEFNNVTEVAWNQATSIASVAYLQKIKPNAEAMYYDVLRHVALISDPEVRKSKDLNLRASIDQAVIWGLQNVLTAYGSFKYEEEWNCNCDIPALLAQRDAEQAQLRADENARLQRSMAEKKRFESGDIPESSPLFQKLDAYGTDLDIPCIPFLSGRISCARTVVNLKADLPLPGMPSLSAGFMSNQFTGASTYSGGVSFGLGAEAGGTTVGARLSLSASVTTDGSGVVSDYSVTTGAQVGVSNSHGQAGVSGSMTFGQGGVTDSDFGASAQADLSTALGSASVSVEGSTKRGCSLSGKVEQSLQPVQQMLDEGSEATLGKDYADMSPTKDLLKKELWSGSFSL